MSASLVAALQLSPGEDRRANLDRAAALLSEAAARGARIAVLPEMFGGLLPPERWRETAEPAGGATEGFLASQARAKGVHVVGGSYVERSSDGRFFNTCACFDAQGRLLGRYRKMHLFWTDIPGATRYDERSHLVAGDKQCVFEVEGLRVAVGICYDLRFPEFFRMPEGRPVDLYCLGAAFMEATGRAHWEVLARARAIENLAFFAAAGTVGRHYDIHDRPGESVATYGHSMIVSPWGEVVDVREVGEGLAVAEVSRAAVEEARGRLGALSHIREDLWPRAH